MRVKKLLPDLGARQAFPSSGIGLDSGPNMIKRLLLHETTVPTSRARRREVSVGPSRGAAVGAGIHAGPAMAQGFRRAACECTTDGRQP
jgi:hypothetical protein